MALMSNGAGGTSLGWSITSSSLTTANIQMGFAGLSSGGDLDAMWKAGVTGLVSGALTGGVNNIINPRFHNLGFFKAAGIHGITGGASSLFDGYINDKRGKELFWYTLRGAGTSALIGGLQEGLTTRYLEKGNFFTGGQRIGKDGGYILREKVIIKRPDFTKLFDSLNRFNKKLDEIPFFSGPRPTFYF